MHSTIEIGDRFGEWTVIGYASKHKRRKQVRVRCSCGFERDIVCYTLTRRYQASRQCISCSRSSVHRKKALHAIDVMKRRSIMSDTLAP